MSRRTIIFCALLTVSSCTNAYAAVDFKQQVLPIFMENCAGCHGEKKGLGKLRLHTAEAIQEKWNADDHLIVKGKPEESELYERLVLPADHKKFMPKKGKPLPKEKLSLIRQWIEQGAAFTVAAEASAVEKSEHAANNHADHKPKELPLPEVGAADDAALAALAESGAQITPLYAGSNLLQISYALRSEPATDAELSLLSGVADQIYALNLAKAQISPDGMSALANLKNLAKLHLENSSVSDTGLTHLGGLSQLQYLNLYGTEITDAGIKPLENLKHLGKLYLWQTKVSYDAAKSIEKTIPGLVADLGFDHPVVVRNRLTKQLEDAKAGSKEADSTLKQAKAAYEKAQKDQEASKKLLDKVQKELDKLNGKSKPAEKAAEKKPETKT